MRRRCFSSCARALGGALIVVVIGVPAPAETARAGDQNAAAVVVRIDPPESESVYVRGSDRHERLGFLSPLYAGDEVIVQTPGTVVQLRIFGRGTETATSDAPVRIQPPPAERGLSSNVFLALLHKVAHSGERTRRNLVTRGEGDGADLELYGWEGEEQVQMLVAGRRPLFLRWNKYLSEVTYEVRESGSGAVLAAGTVNGEFVVTEPVPVRDGARYSVEVRTAAGESVSRSPGSGGEKRDLAAKGAPKRRGSEAAELPADSDFSRWRLKECSIAFVPVGGSRRRSCFCW